MRQTQRERYKGDKDKINAKTKERRKQKKEEQLLINQKQFMPIISFSHSIYFVVSIIHQITTN